MTLHIQNVLLPRGIDAIGRLEDPFLVHANMPYVDKGVWCGC